jgi:Zn-dependent protease
MAQVDAPRRGRWSWSLGKLAGIQIRLHATFLLLIAWIALSHLLAGHGARATLAGIAFVGVVFLVVVLHELGHALMARRFGIATRDIILLPIGGVSRLERIPTEPRQELLVAVAGPFVNVVLAGITLVAILLVGAPWTPDGLATFGGPLLAKFLWLNVGLAVFNLLPAFPMDGGRVLRAFIALFSPRVRATDIASRVGQIVAVGFALIGLFTGQLMLFFIALFVWFGAREEARTVHVSAALESLRVGDAMVTRFESLPAEAPIAYGVERALHGVQREFPVVDRDRLVGFISADVLVTASSRVGEHTQIGAIMRPIGQVADPAEPVNDVLGRLRPGDSVLPVFSFGRFVGLLFPETVVELLSMRNATA